LDNVSKGGMRLFFFYFISIHAFGTAFQFKRYFVGICYFIRKSFFN